MAIYQGGTFGPGWVGQPGDVYINATIYATSTFGEGTVFDNPTFNRCCAPHYNNPPTQVGRGSVVNGGYWDSVSFGEGTTLKSGGGGSYSNQGTQDAAGRTYGQGGRTVKSAGHIITASEVKFLHDGKSYACGCAAGDWDREVLENGYLILNDDGSVTVTVPSMVVVCNP